MANKKFTQLPAAVTVTDTDIFAQSQDVTINPISRKVTSLLYWEYTLGKVLSNAGTPTGTVAGKAGQFCFDTTNHILYLCTTTGTALNAVWSRQGNTFNYPGNPNGLLAGQTYDLCYDSVNGDFYICTTPGTAPIAAWSALTPTIASPLPLSKGGTGKSLTADNGAIVYCDADSFELLAHTTVANRPLMSGNATAPTWSVPSYPNASVTSGKIIISDGTNYIASTSIWPNTVGTAGKIIRSDGTVNAYSTSTFADTYAASTILYSNGANTVTGLATANNGVLITSAGGVPSISSTLPTAVQDNITRLGTIVSGTWHATAIGEIYGGTAQTTYTLGDTLYSSAANTLSKLAGNITTTKQYLSQTGTGAVSAAPAWSTVSGSDITGAALTKVDDTNVTLTLGGTPTTALLRASSLTLGWTGQLGLTRGGTAASLVASNGGIVYSDAAAMAILSGTATANKMLLSGSSAAPTWSTSTIPSSAGATANKVLLSDGTNYVLSTPTFPNASATTGKIIISDGTNWIASTPTYPAAAGTSGNVLTSNGTNWVSSAPATAGTVTSVATSGLATGGTITSTGTVTVTAASQADQETGTSTTVAVTPGVQKFHPSSAKAWVCFDVAASISSSFNTTSITDGGTGIFTANWTVSFSSANYTVAVTLDKNGNSDTAERFAYSTTRAAGSLRCTTVNQAETLSENSITGVYIVAYGDQ